MSAKDRNLVAEAVRAVHQQIRQAENARQLRCIPVFKLPTEMPERLAELLGELRHAEKKNGLPARRRTLN